jgi:cyanophycinase
VAKRHLFLQGGGPPFGEQFAKKFADLSFGERGKVGILFVEREGWQDYMPNYTGNLAGNGVDKFFYYLLTETPSSEDIHELRSCTGIVIGGGDTERYRGCIVDTAVGKLVKERYSEGVPVAGFSAGALISPEHCVIPPMDNAENEHLFLAGLGLIKDCVISVHYTFWNEEDNLKAAVAKAGVSVGYGIDDEAGLYFENEILSSIDGGEVYTFEGKTKEFID